MQSDTSLVEIDLVRGGQRVLAMPSTSIPPEWHNGLLAAIRKGWQGRRFRLYHLPLREPMPPLPIPLRQGEKPILLDLQAVHDECYRKGRYDRLNYALPPEPPLAADDDVWATSLLIEAGKRPLAC
jgi:hypothetical protein